MKIIFTKTTSAFLILALILPFGILVKGQTNPLPFDLSTGSYEFTSWDSLSPAGSFPPNMAFHYVAANQTSPFYTDGSFDFNCSYKKSKRSRINGFMNQGIGIVTTSSSQYNNCDAGTAESRFMGAIVLALNTIGRSIISVSWKSETLIPGDGSPTEPRVWNLRLQYRVGNTGLYTDIPGPVEFVSSVSPGDSVQFGPITLPFECHNLPVVQLRWIYFESDAGVVGGSRPELRLDDIKVTSEELVGLPVSPAKDNKWFSIYPNPAREQFTVITKTNNRGTIQVTDQVGRLVMQQSFSRISPSFDCSNLPKGIYFVKVTDTSNGLSRTNKLLIQ